MYADFCTGCNFNDYPDCISKKIIRNITFEKLLSDNITFEQYLVCPLNAQKLYENKLELTEKCNHCYFCKYLCINNKEQNILKYDQLESIITSDYNKLQILLNKWNPTLKIATEVTFNGNFRTKRLDLVIINNSEVFLVKVLKDINKFDYYKRSYEYIRKEYSTIYNNLNFKPLFLVYSNSNHIQDTSIININELLNLTRRL